MMEQNGPWLEAVEIADLWYIPKYMHTASPQAHLEWFKGSLQTGLKLFKFWMLMLDERENKYASSRKRIIGSGLELLQQTS